MEQPKDNDEIFRFLRWHFNVSKFKRLYESKPSRFSVLSYRASELAGQNDLIAIDRHHLSNMAAKSYLTPLYGVEWNGSMLIIDGHHRIEQAMAESPDLFLSVVVMPARMVSKILCT